MKGIFVESPVFDNHRKEYRHLQNELMDKPKVGAVIQGTGGLRKTRAASANIAASAPAI